MKKLLLLGGSSQQVVAIEKAKDLGYYTVLCDYLEDNPGQHYADKFYLASTTDKDLILNIAKKENINGIVAYSSDPAAPTAAYVAETLCLPGVPYDTAKAFCNKNLFRDFLKKHDFKIPNYVEISDEKDFNKIQNLNFPVIVKPTDSSGSKGVSVINKLSEIENACSLALGFSRNEVLIAEEFIDNKNANLVEAEIFVINGKVVVWGIMDSVRDNLTNPLIPVGYSYPSKLCKQKIDNIKNEISRLVTVSNVKNGAFNIEMLVSDINNTIYFLDVGPRNGGNMLPEFIGMIKEIDITTATLCASMGDMDKIQDLKLDWNYPSECGLYVIHSATDGILKDIIYSKEAKCSLVKEHYFIKIGDSVSKFNKSRDAIGLSFFRFKNKNIKCEVLENFENIHINAKIV